MSTNSIAYPFCFFIVHFPSTSIRPAIATTQKRGARRPFSAREMQSAFRCYHGSIARGLRAGERNLLHTGTLPLPTPTLGIDRAQRRTHPLSCCHNRAWSHGLRTKALDLSRTGLGNRAPFGQLASSQGDQSGQSGREGGERQTSETRTRDSPAESSRRGRWTSQHRKTVPIKANLLSRKVIDHAVKVAKAFDSLADRPPGG